MTVRVVREADEANFTGDVAYNWQRRDPSWHPTELAVRLWQGGTPDDDLLVAPGSITSPWAPSVQARDFESCVTLTPLAGPAGTGVSELRVTFHDADHVTLNMQALGEAVEWALGRHRAGDRVLVRCHAGLVRSGLVAVPLLTWVDESLSFDQALAHARSRRHPLVLARFEVAARQLARPGS